MAKFAARWEATEIVDSAKKADAGGTSDGSEVRDVTVPLTDATIRDPEITFGDFDDEDDGVIALELRYRYLNKNVQFNQVHRTLTPKPWLCSSPQCTTLRMPPSPAFPASRAHPLQTWKGGGSCQKAIRAFSFSM